MGLICITIFISFVLNFGCNEAHTKQLKVVNNVTINNVLDTSKFAILSFDIWGKFGFDSTYSFATLNESDSSKIEILIYQSIQQYNSKLSKERFKYKGVDTGRLHYKMQIIPAMNNKGQKEIWVNGFCSHRNGWREPFNQNWKEQIVLVEDGGNCYFNFKINLDTKEYYSFYVNGYA